MERSNIKKLYEEGLSSIKIGKIYGVSHTTILNFLKENNCKRRTTTSHLKKYIANSNYFQKITNYKKAYFVGFFYADGYNREDQKSICIKIGEKDIEILEKLKKDIKSNNHIKIYKSYKNNQQNMAVLSIHNQKISFDLAKLGAHQNKSLTLNFPSQFQINKKYLSHFIRGYFDGDGCISIPKNNPTRCQITFCGTQPFSCKLKDVLTSININSCIIKQKNQNVYHLIISGRQQCIHFMEWIYKHSRKLYLTRKYDKYLEIKKYIPKYHTPPQIK